MVIFTKEVSLTSEGDSTTYTVKLARAKLPANAGNFICSSQVKKPHTQFTCVTCSSYIFHFNHLLEERVMKMDCVLSCIISSAELSESFILGRNMITDPNICTDSKSSLKVDKTTDSCYMNV